MYMLSFGIVHRGCIVNELSRALPQLRMICPGGFIVSPSAADEVLVLDHPSDADLEAVLSYAKNSPGIAEAEVLERSSDKVFVRILTCKAPESYCSEAVAKHHCFRIGLEIQEGGVELWNVGCRNRSQADALVEELKSMGQLKNYKITEASWNSLIEGISACQ